jgi:ferric-dicitrate binding protein FerR (iron transport regulator)
VSDDYLWDRSGPRDAEVERLEQLLGALRTTPPVPEWPATTARVSRTGRVFLAAAATLLLACSGALWFMAAAPVGPSWSVARVDGTPIVGTTRLSGVGRLAVGEWLRTDAGSRASLAVADIGQIEIDPETRLRLVASGTGRHELEMAQGTVHATIWAPPGQFLIETPASTAIDLGCAYTLSVDPHGGGTIDVEIGWVGFEYQGREAFIPAGARCLTRPRIGPGTPFYTDLDPRARAALETIDFGAPDSLARRDALAVVVSAARRADAMTLWHLLSRVPAADRLVVFDALAKLVPPPPGVTRDGIRSGDRAMRDRWWDALDLGTSDWWRTWERQWR